MRRRSFVAALLGGSVSSFALPLLHGSAAAATTPGTGAAHIPAGAAGLDIFGYLTQSRGGFDGARYRQILGAANDFKEGDQLAGVAAANPVSRRNAQALLRNTRIGDLQLHPVLSDRLSALLKESLDPKIAARLSPWTLGQLRRFLVGADEAAIQAILPGLASEVIGCVVKLMSSSELRTVSAKLFHPLPGSQLGAKGYLGARLQPTSPTDNMEDLIWQVLDGWSYGVGDLVLGANPVSSDPIVVARLESALHDLLSAFGLQDTLPHCVLAPMAVQSQVEQAQPGTTGIWFQSLGGSDRANSALDVTVDALLQHAKTRTGKWGMYFETGQGGELFSGSSDGCDLLLHEARRYGLARALKQAVAQARGCQTSEVWLHVNSVAGFLGPQVFRSREQLVRCCLEDLVMGKLHGLMMGLDVCSSLTMKLSLDDLDWCLEQILPANPGYLVGLPTKRDPMLGYYSTAFQDHVRLRQRFGFKVSDAMARFFAELGILDGAGRPTAKFGDPTWIYLQYQRRKGDLRSDSSILAEATQRVAAVRRRGVPLATGHGNRPSDMEPQLHAQTRSDCAKAQRAVWAELSGLLVKSLPAPVQLRSRARDRSEFLLCPESGEQLDQRSETTLRWLHSHQRGGYDVQLLISDGLNAQALDQSELLLPYLKLLRSQLLAAGYRVAPEHLLLSGGRVRAGYRVGELLLHDLPGKRAIIHITGERPGSASPSLSAYITAPSGQQWAQRGLVDHRCTRVVCSIDRRALPLPRASSETVRALQKLTALS